MNDDQIRKLIEKLRRLTTARGATEAEAKAAKKKAADLEARLPKTRHPEQKIYVDGWPGQPHCDHIADRTTYQKNKKLVCKKCGCEYVPDVHVWKKFS